MTAPETGQPDADDAREEALFRADLQFLEARMQFNEIQQKTISEEIHLNNDAIDVQLLEVKAESHVSDPAELQALGHEVFEASTDAIVDPNSRFDDLTGEEDELVARYEEFKRQPIEARDPEEAQALVQQMHDLVNQANEVHDDFVGQKQEVEARIDDVRVEVQAVLDSGDTHAANTQDEAGWFTSGAGVHAAVGHDEAEEPSSEEGTASDAQSGQAQGSDEHDASATAGDGGD